MFIGATGMENTDLFGWVFANNEWLDFFCIPLSDQSSTTKCFARESARNRRQAFNSNVTIVT